MGLDFLMVTQQHDSAWPAEWTGKPRSALVIFGTVLLSAFALAATAAALWQAVIGAAVSAVVLGVLAIYFGHIAGLGLHGIFDGRRRTDTAGVRQEPEGLVFRYAAAPTYWLSATVALTIVALVGICVVAVGQGGAQGYVIATVLAVAAILLGVFLAVFLRLAPGQVVVSADGIHHRWIDVHALRALARVRRRRGWLGQRTDHHDAYDFLSGHCHPELPRPSRFRKHRRCRRSRR
ncbi:hypothetical protein [Plantactinospora sp. KLBMP9567]|uniref:hypothetical protein n=1 Tax=Plantactinospora sp. KLBMP9567 TaxID=3085900 RepID=UPI002981F8E2|nr:hypothetical protein [Plantactinospora sp. KLBMP9567]MDW5330733.1 hypothetical protein [Plantactinospora sp. KLBMP9567]